MGLTALERTLASRQPPAAWIRHSDQGVQYVGGAYTERLLAAGAQISMAAKGTPLENAQAERFFRTLKQEEVYLCAAYADSLIPTRGRKGSEGGPWVT